MQIWAGLGNPGAQYAMHRHNVGFMAVDSIAEVHGFGAVRKQFQGWVQEGRIGAEKILLLKPATFMNDSGRSIGEALRFYKLDIDALTVFHDELDLAPFKIKVKTGGGTAGHNGLRSTDQHLGPDFRRVRIGIGHPWNCLRTAPKPWTSAIESTAMNPTLCRCIAYCAPGLPSPAQICTVVPWLLMRGVRWCV
ncbi:MAG: aminoacyl-tRNA hydrolase [Sphingomonas sp.]|nr:MAG: aminoacyl-tRNA hydrolase [Sphingomonas sp.]